MASTEKAAGVTERAAAPQDPDDLAGLEAGLDALDATQTVRTPIGQTLLRKVLPPVTAVALVLVVWQILVWAEVAPPYKLASPSDVWGEVRAAWLQGTLLEYIWTSVSRGLLGFLFALAIGTPSDCWWRGCPSSGRPSARSSRVCNRCRRSPGCRPP